MAALSIRSLNAHYKLKYLDDTRTDPNIIIYINPGNVYEWYFIIFGLEQYPGGKYVFKLVANDEYPKKPPSLYCLTPNGIFEINCKICISVGEFHADAANSGNVAQGWRPALGMVGYAVCVMSCMVVPDTIQHGIGVVGSKSDAVIKTYASQSHEFNLANVPMYKEMIELPEVKHDTELYKNVVKYFQTA